jgi:hypothetical protein
MNDMERWAAIAVAIHTIVVSLHAVSHQALQIAISSAFDAVLIGGAFFAAPIASALLLPSRPAVARPLLLASMVISFAYGAVSHYVLPTPDHVAFVRPEGWGLVFIGTTAVLAVIEAIAILLGVLLVTRGRVQPQDHGQ